MIHPWYEKVMSLLKEEEQDILQNLGDGVCSSFDHYQLMAGEIQGLKKAQEILKESLKAFHEGQR